MTIKSQYIFLRINNFIVHIDIKYHFVREQIEKGDIEVLKVHTSKNAQDILTKPTTQMKFERCLELIGFDDPGKG